jgi:hypothetical protein
MTNPWKLICAFQTFFLIKFMISLSQKLGFAPLSLVLWIYLAPCFSLEMQPSKWIYQA